MRVHPPPGSAALPQRPRATTAGPSPGPGRRMAVLEGGTFSSITSSVLELRSVPWVVRFGYTTGLLRLLQHPHHVDQSSSPREALGCQCPGGPVPHLKWHGVGPVPGPRHWKILSAASMCCHSLHENTWCDRGQTFLPGVGTVLGDAGQRPGCPAPSHFSSICHKP